MRIYLTLDYELFLRDPGSAIKTTLLIPTERLNAVLSRFGIEAVYFVDAGYLAALEKFKQQHLTLSFDYQDITTQLKVIQHTGHELALHTHPHWEDAFFDGQRWHMDLSRFKLADFTPAEAKLIFSKYHTVLQKHSKLPLVSHRSGGWCLEPFSYIKDAMKDCGIFIDSTVYENGYVKTATHSFDYRNYPKKDCWRFSHDPSEEDPHGYFIEVPGASTHLGPSVFWRILIQSLLSNTRTSSKGKSVKPSIADVLRKLSFGTVEPVSIDSVKSHSLLKSFKQIENGSQRHFCVIGHPKCFTEDTYYHLQLFIEYALRNGHVFSTFQKSFHTDLTQLP
jgi:hypothetical protein